MLVLALALQAASLPPIPLWGELSTGMTRNEAKALVPNRYVSFAPECGGLIELKFERKVLSSARITAYHARASACGVLIEKSLRTKYGQPHSESDKQELEDCGYGTYGALCRAAGGEGLKTDTTVVWSKDQTRITFGSHNGDYLTIDYDVEPQVTAKSLEKL